ncbi:MAG: T9SS type A sorting domain-containing protein, partial [Candidatus Cloacimonetes bacterium]|nr:T9SS type A sorting domain-containing protein [Candidatus Cloacimonadota bacterium]MCK9178415.1 T9SS type A sorting domain-containing protein [Candidatus Cloacimonadota bacterium]
YSKLDFDYNLIRGGYSSISKPGILSILEWGEHNLSQEPAFASIDYTDPNFLHLSGDSPAVDTGTPDISELGLPPYDLAGNLRVWNNRIDLGCFEYGSEPWVFNDDPVAPSLPETGIIAYPNPFNALTNIKIGLMNHTSKGNINVASVKVYNLKGQLIKSIPLDPARIDEQIVPWDGRDAQNHYCANGIYFLKLQINGKNRGSKKITYIK